MDHGGSHIVFPAHALLILEERLKTHRLQGLLPDDADLTALGIQILLLASRRPRPEEVQNATG